MRSVILLAATALTLSACQRPAEEASPPITADEAIDAQPTEAQPDRTTPPAPAPVRSSNRKADAAADTAAAEVSAAAPAAADGPTPAVRDGAKQAAEETNLHPRTP
ncbi:hypothetical protein ACIQC9_03835 [Brevundimonas sp. NPDC092305]|uniref:hypothetical protein n=1 Tax=Brevundimonas sp. NPDC092305 TaxID=3363957 RepID=UPI0037F63C9C